MQIDSVITYLGSWDRVKNENQPEIGELLSALPEYLSRREEARKNNKGFMPSSVVWERLLQAQGWQVLERRIYSDEGRRVPVGQLGPIKNGVAAQLSFQNPSWFHRWVFTQGALAVRYGLVATPILLAPTSEYVRRFGDGPGRDASSIEYILDQLELLAPLSIRYPFLVIGYSDNYGLFEPTVHEIPSDPTITTEKIVINRSIEFPPEYHQAGLGILNYFGTYLRERYPDTPNTVRIEQHGTTVRLIVEAEDGSREVVEKALHEYELIVSGKESPAHFTSNDRLLLELRNELRIAQVRVESQQDIIKVQNHRIDTLLGIVGDGLRNSTGGHMCIDFKPNISNSTVVQNNSDIALSISVLSELLDHLPASSEAFPVFQELQRSLEAVECEPNKEKVRSSGAISKFRRILDKLNEGESALRGSIEAVDGGIEIVRDLAERYNAVAAWCGLPAIAMQLFS